MFKATGKATNLSTSEIRQMVEVLNRPPFSMNMSLVELDDKSALELLELLNKVLSQLDSKHGEVDIRNENQNDTSTRITGFLKVMGYPSDYSMQFMREIVGGEKRTINHIIHWVTFNFGDLKKKAYISKFLVPVAIPPEFQNDPEISEAY